MTTLHNITSPEQVTKVRYLNNGTLVYEQEVGVPFKVVNNIFKLVTLLQADTVTSTFNQLEIVSRGGVVLATIDLAQPYIKVFGTRLRVEAYFDIVVKNIWVEIEETDTVFNISSVASVDSLPQARDVLPNSFVVGCGELNPVIAYTDQRGLWNFSEYDSILSYRSDYNVLRVDGTYVDVDVSTVDENLHSSRPDSMILQFLDSHLYSVCRRVANSTEVSLGVIRYQLFTPLELGQQVSKVAIYRRKMLGDEYIVPIATNTRLGVVKIGDGLLVTELGVLSLDPNAIPSLPVLSVNGMTGHVTIDTSGFVKTVDGIGPDANGNISIPPYNLPVASKNRLGGIRVGDTLTIDPDGVLDINGDSIVLSVNGMTGHVFIPNLVQTVNGEGPDASGNIQLPPYELPVATRFSLGGIKVGEHLAITPEGKLSVSLGGLVTSVNGMTGDVTLDPYLLPPATTTTLGGVMIGTGFVVEDGKISLDESLFPVPPVFSVNGMTGDVTLDPYLLPIATQTVIGGVIVGETLVIDGNGVLEVDVTKLPLHPDPYVTSVNGLTGDVVISPYELPIATQTSLGGVIVGEGFTITPEGLLSVDQYHYEIVTATTTRTGVIRVGSYLTATAEGVLNVNWSALPYATKNTRGPIMPSDTSFLVEDGVLDVNWDAAPLADVGVKGAIIPGDHFLVNDGVLSLNYDTFPVATTSTKGAVIVGEGLDVDANGVISLPERDDPVVTLNGRNGHVIINGMIDPTEISGIIPNTVGIYLIGSSTAGLPIPYVAGQQAIAFGYGSICKIVYLAPSAIAGKTFIRQGAVWRDVTIIDNFATDTNPGLVKVGETLIISDSNVLDIRNLLNDRDNFEIQGTPAKVGIKPWHHNNTIAITSMDAVSANADSFKMFGDYYSVFNTNNLVGFTTQLHFTYSTIAERSVVTNFAPYTTTIEGESVRVEYIVSSGYLPSVNGEVPVLPAQNYYIPKIVEFTIVSETPAGGGNPKTYQVYLHGDLMTE